MKALVVDDHPIIIRGCKYLLEDTGIKSFVGAASVEEGYEVYRRERPDVVIVDLAIGDDSQRGLQFLDLLHAHQRHTPVIVFSMHDDPEIVTRAVRSGASAYVLKDATAREFEDAVRSVLGGKRYLSEDLAQRITFASSQKREGLADLSPAESETLDLIGEGKTYDYVAAQLNVSKKTVVNTVAGLKRKLGTPTLNELLSLAVTACTKRISARRGRTRRKLM